MDDAARRHGPRDSASGRRRSPAPHTATLTPPDGLPTVGDDARPVVPPPRQAAPAEPAVGLCVCLHPKAAHEHWRRGTDCGICGSATCRAYRRRGGPLRRFLRRIGLAR